MRPFVISAVFSRGGAARRHSASSARSIARGVGEGEEVCRG
jgi:hypothetical protein